MKKALPLEKRLAILQLVLLATSTAIWFLFTDRSRGQLAEVLFWVGIGSVCVGVAILCGAWKGFRDSDVDLILGPSHKRHARLFGDVRRAYGDLNLFALSGCITIIISLII